MGDFRAAASATSDSELTSWYSSLVKTERHRHQRFYCDELLDLHLTTPLLHTKSALVLVNKLSNRLCTTHCSVAQRKHHTNCSPLSCVPQPGAIQPVRTTHLMTIVTQVKAASSPKSTQPKCPKNRVVNLSARRIHTTKVRKE